MESKCQTITNSHLCFKSQPIKFPFLASTFSLCGSFPGLLPVECSQPLPVWCCQSQIDFCSNKLLKFVTCLSLSLNSWLHIIGINQSPESILTTFLGKLFFYFFFALHYMYIFTLHYITYLHIKFRKFKFKNIIFLHLNAQML